MLDQAEALRTLVRDRILHCSRSPHAPRLYTLAVTSGKGGVGKTSLAVNLALLAARAGRQVRLVDADFGLSNAEVLLGATPKLTLIDVIRGRVEARDAWMDVANGVKLLSSGSGLEEMANLDGGCGARVLDHLMWSASDGDLMIVDTAPGIDESVISLVASADEVMVVTTPEPTSITDSYAAIKVLLARRPEADITLVANCCSGPAQATAVAQGLERTCSRFLGRSFDRYEYLPSDAAVGWAIRTQRPLAFSATHSAIGPWLRKMTIKLDARVRARAASAKGFPETTAATVGVSGQGCPETTNALV